MSSHKRAVYAFAALLLTVVGILIVPLPPWLLDVLLGINVFSSALVLLLSVTIEDPLEFSAFAPALLVATLFRLSLDVSATRLILTARWDAGRRRSDYSGVRRVRRPWELGDRLDRLFDLDHNLVRCYCQRVAARR